MRYMAKRNDKSAKSRGFKLVSFETDLESWKAFRILAIERGSTASELIRSLIKAELSKVRRR